MEIDVFGVGNAIVDLQLKVADSFLDEISVEKGLMTLVESDRQAAVLQALSGQDVSRCSGGSACNTVVGVADMGGTGSYACKTGTDDLGKFYIEDLDKVGVQVPVGPSDGMTGTSVILITPDAQRTMLTNLGISASLTADDIKAEDIAKARYLYVEGYLFPSDPTRSAALKAIELAKEAGVPVALTLSDPFIVGLCKDLFLELIEGPVDLVFANLEEARSLTDHEDPADCASAIHKHATQVAMTLGAEGSLLMHGGQTTPIEGVPTEAIDTTGAGDMYAAGVLYGLTHDMTWRQAGRLGSHAASRIVSQMGARLTQKFTADEIVEIAD